MNQLTNQDFIKFIQSFDNFYLPITDISKAKTPPYQSLVHNNFKMYSLDDICKNSNKLRNNLPKTMDAIYFKNDESKKLTLYIIEFKHYNIDNKNNYLILKNLHEKLKRKNKQTIDDYSNDKIIDDNLLKQFEKIKRNYVDSVELSLILKPIESLIIALPILYEEYCLENNLQIKNIKQFLNEININLLVFVNRYAQHNNITANHAYSNIHSVENTLKCHYDRLVQAGIIKNYNIHVAYQFNSFLKREKLIQSENS